MAANVESMFYVGEVPWHGQGIGVKNCPTSKEAIELAGLDWKVEPKPIFDQHGNEIHGYKVNVRSSDGKPLGVVSDKYKVVQNEEAFAFTDELLGEGVQYESAGSLASGKRVWLLARLEGTTLAEEKIDPYLVFTNTHDGTGAIKVAVSPIRVVCQNTLNLALKKASRHWSCMHKGDIASKLEEARFTLSNTQSYLDELEKEFGSLKLKTVTDNQVKAMTEILLQAEFTDLYNKATANVIDLAGRTNRDKYKEKLDRKRTDILNLYQYKSDLVGTERSAFRFVNAVSDYATHTTDHRNTKNYQENLFMKTIDGNSLIDTAYKIALAA